jgi:hypothetical protein
MIIEPSSNKDDLIFEAHSSAETHLSKPEQTPKFPDLEGIREQVFGQKNKDFENSTGVNSKPLEESCSSEKNNDHFPKCLEEVYFDDDDLLLIAVNQDETADHEVEISVNKDETADHEVELEMDEVEIAQTEEISAHREKEEENLLNLEGDKVDQEVEREVEEGSVKTVIGDKAVRQGNTEIEQVNANPSARIEDAALINGKWLEARNFAQLNQAFIHQCNELSHQNDFKRNENISLHSNNSISVSKITIDKDKRDDRAKHVKQVVQVKVNQLNHLDSQNKIDVYSINEAIRHELKRESFENVYNENGVLLHEDEAGVEQLTKDIQDFKKNHPTENLSQIVRHRTVVWLSSKNPQMKNPQGDLVPISQERQRELATILSYGVVIQIVNQVTNSQKISQEHKVDEEFTSATPVTGEVRQHQFYRIHGQRFKLDSLESIGTTVKENFINKPEIDKENAKSLDKSHLDIIDEASRISQMTTSKEIITSEIEHLDQEHVIVVIDRVRLKKMKGMS